MQRSARAALAAALLLGAAGAEAQGRPSEEDLFGAPAAKEQPPAGSPAPAAAPPSGAKEDPLRVGGQLYLRATTSVLEGDAPGDFGLSSPNLMDVYLDVRPNDRVRGFALGRMSYDPTRGREAPSVAAAVGAPGSANPTAVLDQLWVNFDVARTVFVTAGKQHVKWGVGRFWNPTDWLHARRRDPLAPFDARAGAAMVKLHLPWEKRGWNLYGIALLEDLDAEVPEPASPGSLEAAAAAARGPGLRGVAGGGRAEVVLGSVEIGADALLKDGRRPRFGFDVSAGIWELDVYAEVALRTSSDLPRWRAGSASPAKLDWVQGDRLGFTPAVVAGGEWSAKYSDEDAVTLGAEYFFDDSGYPDAGPYTFLALGAPDAALVARDPAAFTPFYLGRHYAAAWVRLPSPGRWNDTTFTLSAVGNLSDRSFVVRLDHSVLALTYLRVETFVAAHMGAKGGEFRLDLRLSPQDVPILPEDTTLREAPVLDAGIALRVSL